MTPKILIATASFGELDSSILNELQDSYECVFNHTGRKLTNEELSKLILTLSTIDWSNGLPLTSANCLGNPILLELPAAKITAAFKTKLTLKLNHRMLVQ